MLVMGMESSGKANICLIEEHKNGRDFYFSSSTVCCSESHQLRKEKNILHLFLDVLMNK